MQDHVLNHKPEPVEKVRPHPIPSPSLKSLPSLPSLPPPGSPNAILTKLTLSSDGKTKLHPPFNMSDWADKNRPLDERCFSLSASIGERAGVQCRIRSSPMNNANYARIQHFIHHLSPMGVAGFVMSNGSVSTQTSNEGETRRPFIKADLVNYMVGLWDYDRTNFRLAKIF